MARTPGQTKAAPRRGRSSAPAVTKANPVAPVVTKPPAAPAKPRQSFGEWIAGIPRFAGDVRQEARKITWPAWKETWITSVMVFIMVTVTALFFLVVDGSLSFLMQQVLKLAG